MTIRARLNNILRHAATSGAVIAILTPSMAILAQSLEHGFYSAMIASIAIQFAMEVREAETREWARMRFGVGAAIRALGDVWSDDPFWDWFGPSLVWVAVALVVSRFV